MGGEDDGEVDEVADILRGRTTIDPSLRPALDALEDRLGHPVIALTFGSMNSVAGHGIPGVEVPTMTAWVRGAAFEPELRRQAEAAVEGVASDFGPWRWQQFTARAVRVGNLSASRSRRIAALTDEVTDPILSGLGYFDEDATTRLLAAIPQERWDRFRDDWGVWTVAVNAELHRVSVFVHTLAQQQATQLREWERQIRTLIAERDEFGSTGVIPIEIALESRESFESDYQGNWSYYWY